MQRRRAIGLGGIHVHALRDQRADGLQIRLLDRVNQAQIAARRPRAVDAPASNTHTIANRFAGLAHEASVGWPRQVYSNATARLGIMTLQF